ncbi:MAG: hypothetical protein U0441_19720 [Polyangiaceae bacterium]
MVLLQHILVRWTKRSRGAPRAAQRNAVPSAVPVSIERLDKWVIQEVSFHENTDFRRKMERQRALHDYEEEGRCLTLRTDHDGLHVGFRWSVYVGAPRRPDRPEAFLLKQGDYGRVVVNGRQAEESTHVYSLHTYNITLAEAPAEDTFTAREPDQLLDLRAKLF